MMQDLEMKKKVAQEIMDLMDQKDGERLKMKSPKFAKIEVASVDPKIGDDAEESSESPMDKMKELKDPGMEMKEPEHQGEEDQELSPELIAKLLEMVNGK
jgi:hypothetical protein